MAKYARVDGNTVFIDLDLPARCPLCRATEAIPDAPQVIQALKDMCGRECVLSEMLQQKINEHMETINELDEINAEAHTEMLRLEERLVQERKDARVYLDKIRTNLVIEHIKLDTQLTQLKHAHAELQEEFLKLRDENAALKLSTTFQNPILIE
jgi:predicted YcjX-like family ATPase